MKKIGIYCQICLTYSRCLLFLHLCRRRVSHTHTPLHTLTSVDCEAVETLVLLLLLLLNIWSKTRVWNLLGIRHKFQQGHYC